MSVILKLLPRALLISVWFAVLTFPVMALRINTASRGVELNWRRSLILAAAVFVLVIFQGRRDDRQEGSGIAPALRLAQKISAARAALEMNMRA